MSGLPRQIVAHCDAGLRGALIDGIAPHCACAAILEGDSIYEERVRYLGAGTVNEGEWSGLILVLETALLDLRLGSGDRLRIFSDSQLVVFQSLGRYGCKDERLLRYLVTARGLGSELRSCGCSVEISHVPREMNQAADTLVGRYLDNILDHLLYSI